MLQAGHSITAIAGRDAERLEQFRIEFGIAATHAWKDAGRLLEDSRIDAIYIPLPNALHAQWTLRALEAGKHVLCEKPLALNLEEAGRVATAAAVSRRVLMENFSYHLTPEYHRAAQNLDTLQSIQVHFSFEATEHHRLRYDPALGGGSFRDLGCYGVDFVHRLLDSEMEILSVHPTPTPPERRDWGLVDETCIVRARTASGVFVTITSSFARPQQQDFTLQYAHGSATRIERADATLALVKVFDQVSESDPADLVRYRRNAAVLEVVQRHCC